MWHMAIGWHLHVFFMATALVGAILCIIYATKLKPKELWPHVKWTLIVGIIGALLTGVYGIKMMHMFKGKMHGKHYEKTWDKDKDAPMDEMLDEMIGQ